jgi:hypothetical protein
MIIGGKIILFLLGMCLAVQILAAFYRIIDLWYTIRTAYPQVIRGIAIWGGVALLTAALIGDNLRNAFLWGLIFYIPFYLANFFLFRLIVQYRCRIQGEKKIDPETEWSAEEKNPDRPSGSCSE